MDSIRVDVGVYTPLEVDLTDFDFTGVSEVVLTFKNKITDPSPLFERSFTASGKHTVMISPEESRQLTSTAQFDFDVITISGLRLKNGPNGQIALRRGVGQCEE